MEFSKEDLLKQVTFKTSRSGGKGGQNVNKVSSKVELDLSINNCTLFSEDQKKLLFQKLPNRINSEGVLQIIAEEERSQYLNKLLTLKKLELLLKNAFYMPKPRKSSKPKASAIKARLKNKQLQALKKIDRKKDFWD
ncbi:MAG: peptide chain release factor-like protein [Daejeonella sp.]